LADRVRMCVVLDTNQWDRMPMLRHRPAALLFALQRRPGTFIGLPSVVRDELQLHLIEKRQLAEDRLDRAAGEIRQILGMAQQVQRHSDEEVRHALAARLAELGPLVEVLPATDDDLLEAGRMVLGYRSPSTRTNQQYRDSVIWRIVVRTARNHDVVLVTSGEGFYARKSGGELAPSLAVVIEGLDGSVTLYRSVEDLLDVWMADQPSPATDDLRDLVTDAVADRLDALLREQGQALTVSVVQQAKIEAYLTERHDELAVSGQFEFFLMHTEEHRGFRHSHRAEVQATAAVGIIAPAGQAVRDIAFDSVTVESATGLGGGISRSAFVRPGSAVVGIRAEPYRLHVPLETPNARNDR
jgi:hypothetical protein